MPLLTGDGWRRSVCCYCGTGCGLLARAKDGVVREVRGDPDHPVNKGKLCAKGALLGQVFDTGDRLLTPMVRDRKGGHTRVTGWDEAIDRVAGVIRRNVEEHGPDSVMLYGSGQLMTEDYYLFGKLAKGFIGTNNQDTNSRLCMASAVAAYNLAFGADSPPASYADIEEANTFLILGANMEACHPILFDRIKARKRADRDGVKVIVVDPRRTRTAEIADLHLPVLPGTDVALLLSLLFEVRLAGGLDAAFIEEHTSGWAEIEKALDGWSAERASSVTGLDAQEIVDAARIIATNGPMLTLWTMGANQSTSGVDKNLALINLSLATGNIGKPGAGPFSLTGQPNAMGGRECGGLATTLPGHRLVADADHRAEVERAWGLEPGSISDRTGLTAIEMVEALERDEVKVVWIAATNPVASLPNAERVRAALRRAELVVGAGRVLPDRDRAHRRRAPARGAVVGAPGHDDQQRAAHLPARADRAGAGPGAAGLADHLPHRRRARIRRRVRLRGHRGDLRRVPRADARPRPRHHRGELRAAAAGRHGHPVAVPRGHGARRRHGRGRAVAAAVRRGAASPRPTGARASTRRGSARRRRYSATSTPSRCSRAASRISGTR